MQNVPNSIRMIVYSSIAVQISFLGLRHSSVGSDISLNHVNSSEHTVDWLVHFQSGVWPVNHFSAHSFVGFEHTSEIPCMCNSSCKSTNFQHQTKGNEKSMGYTFNKACNCS